MTHNIREEFATQLSKSVRYSSGRGQYDAFPDCQDAYLDGVETAIAMMYIDLTGSPKSEGMLAKFLHQELQKARKQVLKEIDIGDNNYVTARKKVAELSGVPLMAITFDEHVAVIKEKLQKAREEERERINQFFAVKADYDTDSDCVIITDKVYHQAFFPDGCGSDGQDGRNRCEICYKYRTKFGQNVLAKLEPDQSELDQPNK